MAAGPGGQDGGIAGRKRQQVIRRDRGVPDRTAGPCDEIGSGLRQDQGTQGFQALGFQFARGDPVQQGGLEHVGSASIGQRLRDRLDGDQLAHGHRQPQARHTDVGDLPEVLRQIKRVSQGIDK